MAEIEQVVDWLQEKIEADPEGMIWISGICDEVRPLFGSEFVTETATGASTLSNQVKRKFKKRMGDRIRLDRDRWGGGIWVLQE